MTLATAEMQFSVALTFSLALESADWITPTSSGTASERTMTTCIMPYDVHETEKEFGGGGIASYSPKSVMCSN